METAGEEDEGIATGTATWPRRGIYHIMLAVLCVASAEVTCRLDDFVRYGVPFIHSPTEDSLKVRDYFGFRGRPHARYRKWQLNRFGFRGPEIHEQPAPGKRRVVVLGASETFGLYESPDREFPAQLARNLGSGYEVVNAALPGMTTASMLEYWKHWVADFHPDIVIVYPSPGFYLADVPPLPQPVERRTAQEIEPEPLRLTSRIWARVLDVVEVPPLVQRERVRRRLAATLASHPADWEFRELPTERLQLLREHLQLLVESIRESGARPVLVTHAVRTHWPPSTAELAELESARVHIPRATPQVISQFEAAAGDVVRQCGDGQSALVVDAQAALSGKRQLFADVVHFTDQGAGAMAQLLADAIAAE